MRSVWRRAAMQLTSGFRDPLDKRGLASGFLTKVWFWGPVHAAPVCCLFVLFVWYMFGAGSVGWCFVFRRPSEYKAPGCERWGEESVVLRGRPAASVLAFFLVCYVWPG